MLPRITTAASPSSCFSSTASVAVLFSARHCHKPKLSWLLGPRPTPTTPFLGSRRHLHYRASLAVSPLNHRLPPITSLLQASASMATSVSDDSEAPGYQLPPPEIQAIVDSPPTPALSFSPKRDKILFLKRRALPSLSDLARPELKLGGLRIDSDSNTRSRMSFYTGISIHSILEDGSLGDERELLGLPESAKINYVSWSKDGRHLAFSIRDEQQGDNGGSTLGLWVADITTGLARTLFGPPELSLNTIFDSYAWLDESTLIACTIPTTRGEVPKKPKTPISPKIQANEEGRVVQARTYQDLLKDGHDSNLFDYYATSQLVLVSLDGSKKFIQPPAVYTSVEPSPDGNYLLVSSIQKPYSYTVPCGRFPKRVELWTKTGEFVREICTLPLAEDIPIAFNSVRKGRRSVGWRADKPASLYWVETQDGGDARVEVSPRDIIYTQPAEDNEDVRVLHKLDLRYGGIIWGDDSFALVYESWYKTRKTRTWIISPEGSQEANILFDRSSEDAYSDPGSPMLRRTFLGTYVLAWVKKDDGKKYLLLNGHGATPEGDIPFLDLLDVNTREKERIWQSTKEKYYEAVVALMSDCFDSDLEFDQLKILFSRESQTERPQYFMLGWPDHRVKQITNFPHPYPQLVDLKKELIKYSRADGVQLSASLYTPPNYEPARDGPLPLIVWSYPGEFKNKEMAGQIRGSPNEFAGIGSTSPLLWLSKGFAVLDGPTIPIIGEGDEEANDRYVEQLVASAEAAVNEVIRRGVARANSVAVGGHSYGAFMTANLLAHASHLFCCGIARAGAYNRTLTPFGFQNEERTLWEAPQTYINMSPFMLANKIKKPLLLVHGEEDNNSGTLTLQSERFFSALKGHGGLCRLVLLPLESHGFSARESIMHVLWEMDRWLQKYCVQDEVSVGAEALNGSSNHADLPVSVVQKPSTLGAESKETLSFQEKLGMWRPLSCL